MLPNSKNSVVQQTQHKLNELGVPAAFPGVALGADWLVGSGESIPVTTPIDGTPLGEIRSATAEDVQTAVTRAHVAFQSWRITPPPQRGQLVRRMGELLRAHKQELAYIVTAECGKIYQESLGEVQEMIDICDFAVGLSRQLYGLTVASERPAHRLMEQWHPLGPIGVISAFNFPVAVWAWNTMIALVCGDPVVWKPSEKTPLTAMACHAIALSAIREFDFAPEDLIHLVCGGKQTGQALAQDSRLPLISATGSVPMGRSVAQTVAARLGRSLLELGGNNAAIVTESADMDLAVRGVVFSAVGTCGQRCTSLRRLIIHDSQYDSFTSQLKTCFQQLSIGNPLDDSTLVGPLIDKSAFEQMQNSLQTAQKQGGTVWGGDRIDLPDFADGYYVQPALVDISPQAPIVGTETFAPITYTFRYSNFSEAIELQNQVSQGLASAVFTSDVRQAEFFCSPAGSDCGIANVNIGTSGAEIGGAFGGEKETGGGRESGSDAWKAYMRRATNTINYSDVLPLAQGIKFDI